MPPKQVGFEVGVDADPVVQASTRVGEVKETAEKSPAPLPLLCMHERVRQSKRAFQLTFGDLDSRVFPVSSTTNVMAVPVEYIEEKCIFVSVGADMNFVARFCSKVHLD